MLAYIIDRSKSMGFHEMELETHSSINEAVALYEKFGFIAQQPPENANPEAGTFFLREIQPRLSPRDIRYPLRDMKPVEYLDRADLDFF